MVARFLVTTAIEDTWPAKDVPVLFLGEWCRLYARKAFWDQLDSKVVPYHWDNRRKLYTDYLFLSELYETSLALLSGKLNEIHGYDNSIRYWRILVGPWLGYFIQMLFDRWFMLRTAINNYDILGVKIVVRRDGELVPNDMGEFTALFVNDNWNELIYGHILKDLPFSADISFSKCSELDHQSSKTAIHRSRSKPFKRFLSKQCDALSCLFPRDDEYFIHTSFLGVKNDYLLQRKLGQLPRLWQSLDVPRSIFNIDIRQWKLPQSDPFLLDNQNSFRNLLFKLIPKHIPMAYLEGFAGLVEFTRDLPWPKKPKAIFTSNSYSSDDVFKAWTSEKVNHGIPLIIGQHGGSLGMSRWGFTEEHQKAIADKFITWGWRDKSHTNVIPMVNLKALSRKSIKPLDNGCALLVGTTLPRYSYHMYSAPVSCKQWQAYFEDQCTFVRELPFAIREQVLVRLYSSDYGYNQRQRWTDNFQDITLDEGTRPMNKLIAQSRIYISTYNATTYLESLCMNFPTIIFWNPEHWELRDESQHYFEILKSVRIFHESPKSAAEHLADVWDDVSGWWFRDDIQSAVLHFCQQYASKTTQPIARLSQLFIDSSRQ